MTFANKQQSFNARFSDLKRFIEKPDWRTFRCQQQQQQLYLRRPHVASAAGCARIAANYVADAARSCGKRRRWLLLLTNIILSRIDELSLENRYKKEEESVRSSIAVNSIACLVVGILADKTNQSLTKWLSLLVGSIQRLKINSKYRATWKKTFLSNDLRSRQNINSS